MEECLIVSARYAAYWIRVSSSVGKWVDLCGLWNAQNSRNLLSPELYVCLVEAATERLK